jgi:uncharacterized protein YbbC (DUF1343 family)
MEVYLPLIRGKRIALVVNHTSTVGDRHLVDTLISSNVRPSDIMRVFVPEHGLRGDFDAGEEIAGGRDPNTGIPVVSLYGTHKKPQKEDLKGIDLVIFDIQDVGVRFYTYISTLHYVMEACAENGVPLLVLDRPNPNGGYVDGPVLEPEFSSFVGMHPIPVVYGLTMGELAGMINGEGWLTGGIRCDLTVIPCNGYLHGTVCTLPVPPSPNLTNDHAIRLYPSTCFFEGTVVSEGRGTPWPFEVYGHPDLEGPYQFTPVSIPGKSSSPKWQDRLCYGEDLRTFIPEEGWTRLHLEFLIEAYRRYPRKEEFFTSYFEKLAGTGELRKQIEAGWDTSRIRSSWQEELDKYLLRREKYLIYD